MGLSLNQAANLSGYLVVRVMKTYKTSSFSFSRLFSSSAWPRHFRWVAALWLLSAWSLVLPGAAGAASLAEGVDAPNLTWTTGGAVDWSGQTNITHDGSDAARGTVNVMGDRSWLATSATGPLQVSFWWKCLTYWPDYDRLAFYIDEEMTKAVNGETAWSPASSAIPAGTHALTWKFEVDSEPYVGGAEDMYAAYLDQVSFSPVILGQPQDTAACVGQSVSLSVSVAGAANFNYQWRKDGSELAGETSSVLAFAGIDEADAGAYQVVISSAIAAGTSAVARVTVLPASPYILRQPLASETVVASSGIMLWVHAAGAFSLSYQWQKNGVDLANETNATVMLLNLQETDSGRYQVLVSSGNNTVASSESVITVLPASAGPGCAGSVDPSFDAGRGTYPFLWPPWGPTPILSATPQADDKVVIAGGFEEVQGLAAPGIARYQATGWIDSNYVANADDVVSHQRAAQPDGRVVRICDPGEDLGAVARFNADGTLDPSFDAELPAGFVARALALQPDGKVCVGGASAAGGGSSPSVVRLKSDGRRDAGFNTNLALGLLAGQASGAQPALYDLVLHQDGRIYIAGFFTAVNGIPRSDVARLNADGTLDLSFEPDLSIMTGADPECVETISALGLCPDGKLVVAGYLGVFNGLSRPVVARLHTAFGGCGGGIVSLEQTTYFIAETNSHVTVALVRRGGTEQPGSVACQAISGSAIAVEDFAAAQTVLAFAPGEARKTVSIPIVNDVEVEHTENFGVQLRVESLSNLVTLNSGTTASVMIYDDDSVGLPGSLDPAMVPLQVDGPVRRLVLGAHGTFVAAGDFTHAGGQPRTGLARFTLEGQLDTSFNPVIDGAVLDFVFDPASEKLFIAGDFSQVNGAPRRALARLNPDGSLDETFAPCLSGGPVEHIALCASGRVLIAGAFTIQTPVLRQQLARLNPDGSLDDSLDIGSGMTSSIMSLIVQPDDKIIIGGSFTRINGVSCSQVARLNADGALDPAFNRTPLFGYVQSLRLGLLADGKILVAGVFYPPSMLGGPMGLLRLNTDGTIDPGWQGGPFASVFALQVDGKILIDGSQRLFPNGAPDLDYFGCNFNFGGGVADLLMLPDGKVLVGGNFITAEGYPLPYLVRLHGGDSGSFGPGYLSFSSASWSASQGTPSITLELQRMYGAVGTVGVDYATVDGTATNGLDYTGQQGTITLADGDVAPRTLTVPLLNNPNLDGNAFFKVVLSRPTGGARLGPNAVALVTLVDTNVVIRISPQIVSVKEGVLSAAFQVIMTGWSSTPVSCQYATRSGTATAGSDFTPVTGTFNFGKGPYSVNWFQVPMTNDDLVEGTETFTVYLTNATSGAVLRASSAATVIVLDDETPPAEIAPLNGSHDPASGQFTLTIGNELGRPYVVEASTDLTTWTVVGTVTNLADWVRFSDPAYLQNQKFYRVRAE
jgi:uncharacterized delta-60 repeat protein